MPVRPYRYTVNLEACGHRLPGGAEVVNCDPAEPVKFTIRFDLFRRIVWIRKENQLIFHMSAAELGFPFPIIDISANTFTTTIDTTWKDSIFDIHCQANNEVSLFYKIDTASGLVTYENTQIEGCATARGVSSTVFLWNHLFVLKEDSKFVHIRSRETGEFGSGYFEFKEGTLPVLDQNVCLSSATYYWNWISLHVSRATTLNIASKRCGIKEQSNIIWFRKADSTKNEYGFWDVEDCRLPLGPNNLLLSAYKIVEGTQEIIWGILAERKKLRVWMRESGQYVYKKVWVEKNTKLSLNDKDSYEIQAFPSSDSVDK